MGEEEKNCERCGGSLSAESGLCPECDEPAPQWLVYTVYGLIALFLVGLACRLLWP